MRKQNFHLFFSIFVFLYILIFIGKNIGAEAAAPAAPVPTPMQSFHPMHAQLSNHNGKCVFSGSNVPYNVG